MKNGLIISNNGTKFWYQNDKRHRIDGPAIEGADGSKSWWLNDKLHRIDGPAYEGADGTKEWWLNGIEYSKLDYYNELLKRNLISRELYLLRIAEDIF